jgi:hypothetical protein
VLSFPNLHLFQYGDGLSLAVSIYCNVVTGYCCWFLWGLWEHTLLIHTGYCCWSVCLGQHFTGYCNWFMWGLRQHTLLDIFTGLRARMCGGRDGRGSGDTPHWVLLLVYVGSRATHFTGYYEGPRTTLYWGIVVGCLYQWVVMLVYVGPWATHFTGYCC